MNCLVVKMLCWQFKKHHACPTLWDLAGLPYEALNFQCGPLAEDQRRIEKESSRSSRYTACLWLCQASWSAGRLVQRHPWDSQQGPWRLQTLLEPLLQSPALHSCCRLWPQTVAQCPARPSSPVTQLTIEQLCSQKHIQRPPSKMIREMCLGGGQKG